MALASGTRLGSYEVIRPLGSGGMGEVYLARDTRLERQVAIKIISPSLAGDPDRLARFVREAKTASSLNHPNIAHVYEIGVEDEVHFIAMEYVRGEDLRVRIGSRGMPIADVVNCAAQIADALDEAHSHGIVHRDLKPANTFVTPRGQIKILDFGLAKTVTGVDPDDTPSTVAGVTIAGLVLGTLDYMSPEQVRGLDLDRRSDIFSFGVMLYEMITGRLPFTSKSKTDQVYRITQVQPEPLSRYKYDVPPDLDRVVRKCLEKEPQRRYQSARELLVDLSSLRRDSTSGSMPASVPIRVGVQSKRWLGAAVVAGVIAVAGLAYYFVRDVGSIDSIAVLPDSASLEGGLVTTLAEGVAASIANSLSALGSLDVAPRLPSGDVQERDPYRVAEQLGVRGVLLVGLALREGAVLLNLQLIDVARKRQEWGQRYTLRLSEIDLAQENIAAEVAETLNLRFNPEQRRAQEVYQL
jgi:serine/threonine protein kinase